VLSRRALRRMSAWDWMYSRFSDFETVVLVRVQKVRYLVLSLFDLVCATQQKSVPPHSNTSRLKSPHSCTVELRQYLFF